MCILTVRWYIHRCTQNHKMVVNQVLGWIKMSQILLCYHINQFKRWIIQVYFHLIYCHNPKITIYGEKLWKRVDSSRQKKNIRTLIRKWLWAPFEGDIVVTRGPQNEAKFYETTVFVSLRETKWALNYNNQTMNKEVSICIRFPPACGAVVGYFTTPEIEGGCNMF